MKKIVVLCLLSFWAIVAVNAQDDDDAKGILDKIRTPFISKPQPETPKVDSLQLFRDSIAILNGEIESLKRIKQNNADLQERQAETERELARLRRIVEDSVYSTYSRLRRANDKFFCRAVMENPLFLPYNEESVNSCLELSEALGYDKRYSGLYELYRQLLSHYEEYTDELVKVIDATIQAFDKPRLPNRKMERDLFIQRLERTQYMQMRGKDESFARQKHIGYLDLQIQNLYYLFSEDSTFKKKEFELIRSYLTSKPTSN